MQTPTHETARLEHEAARNDREAADQAYARAAVAARNAGYDDASQQAEQEAREDADVARDKELETLVALALAR